MDVSGWWVYDPTPDPQVYDGPVLVGPFATAQLAADAANLENPDDASGNARVFGPARLVAP